MKRRNTNLLLYVAVSLACIQFGCERVIREARVPDRDTHQLMSDTRLELQMDDRQIMSRGG